MDVSGQSCNEPVLCCVSGDWFCRAHGRQYIVSRCRRPAPSHSGAASVPASNDSAREDTRNAAAPVAPRTTTGAAPRSGAAPEWTRHAPRGGWAGTVLAAALCGAEPPTDAPHTPTCLIIPKALKPALAALGFQPGEGSASRTDAGWSWQVAAASGGSEHPESATLLLSRQGTYKLRSGAVEQASLLMPSRPARPQIGLEVALAGAPANKSVDELHRCMVFTVVPVHTSDQYRLAAEMAADSRQEDEGSMTRRSTRRNAGDSRLPTLPAAALPGVLTAVQQQYDAATADQAKRLGAISASLARKNKHAAPAPAGSPAHAPYHGPRYENGANILGCSKMEYTHRLRRAKWRLATMLDGHLVEYRPSGLVPIEDRICGRLTMPRPGEHNFMLKCLCRECAGRMPPVSANQFETHCGGGNKKNGMKNLLLVRVGMTLHQLLEWRLLGQPPGDYKPKRFVRGSFMTDSHKDKCSSCGFNCNDDRLLMCEGVGCTEVLHTYCCDPPLLVPPEGTWLCPLCVAKERREKRGRGGRKGADADAEGGVAGEIPLPGWERIGLPTREQLLAEDDPHDYHCLKCQDMHDTEQNPLLCCDGYHQPQGCTKVMHLLCYDPEATAVPEGEWFCPACEGGAARQRQRSASPSCSEEIGGVRLAMGGASPEDEAAEQPAPASRKRSRSRANADAEAEAEAADPEESARPQRRPRRGGAEVVPDSAPACVPASDGDEDMSEDAFEPADAEAAAEQPPADSADAHKEGHVEPNEPEPERAPAPEPEVPAADHAEDAPGEARDAPGAAPPAQEEEYADTPAADCAMSPTLAPAAVLPEPAAPAPDAVPAANGPVSGAEDMSAGTRNDGDGAPAQHVVHCVPDSETPSPAATAVDGVAEGGGPARPMSAVRDVDAGPAEVAPPAKPAMRVEATPSPSPSRPTAQAQAGDDAGVVDGAAPPAALTVESADVAAVLESARPEGVAGE
ncbi:unnamed protein product [Pedinophyceae sp. YPF-701]|nr:unnamed protein product [Pedinophyceae sp. YPF-701]